MSTQPRVPLQRLSLSAPVSLGVFEDYQQAQKAVDHLSDREFPVENCMIVGTELKQVERVTGRLTTGRVALAGLGSGAWFGLMLGLLMSFFANSGMAILLPAVVMGAIFGAIWALLGYSLTRGQRDFTSVSQVVATRYEVLVERDKAADARRLLGELDGPAGRAARLSDATGAGSPGSAPTPTSQGTWAPPTGAPIPGGPDGPTGTAAHPGQYGQQGHYGQQGQSHQSGGAHTGATAAGGPSGPGQGGAPVAPPAPKYRTYGEAMDAQREAERVAQVSPAPSAAPVQTPSQHAGRTPGQAPVQAVQDGQRFPVDPTRVTEPELTQPTWPEPGQGHVPGQGQQGEPGYQGQGEHQAQDGQQGR